jgi:hypothetical protein
MIAKKSNLNVTSFLEDVPNCPHCSSANLYYDYMFSLLITDGTGYLPIIFSSGEATYFLHGKSSSVGPPTSKNGENLEKLLTSLWNCKEGNRVTDAKEFVVMVEAFEIEISGKVVRRYKAFDSRIPQK